MAAPIRIAAIAAAILLSCCSSQEESHARADETAAIRVGKENVVRVESGELVTGPPVSGELEAANTATVRARVGGTVENVAVEEGQSVKKGQLLARIESRTLVNARNSARTAVQSAQTAVRTAMAEVERNENLVHAGAVAQRDLDQARTNLASAQSQLASTQSALQAAEEQVSDATLLAPFRGIVSRLQIHRGDVVAVGAELVSVVDPSSMRLAAWVSSADVPNVRVGNPVEFTIRGYPENFRGAVERIAPEADPVTRLVQVLVAITGGTQHLTAGLFANGRVVTGSASGPIVPNDAVNTEGDRPWVLRLHDGRAERVDVTIGFQDMLTERTWIRSGIAAGDVLLRGTAQAMTPGTPVEIEG